MCAIFETHRGSGFCRQMLVDQVFSGRDNKRCRCQLDSPAPAHFQLPLIWLSCRKFCICLFSQLLSFHEIWANQVSVMLKFQKFVVNNYWFFKTDQEDFFSELAVTVLIQNCSFWYYKSITVIKVRFRVHWLICDRLLAKKSFLWRESKDPENVMWKISDKIYEVPWTFCDGKIFYCLYTEVSWQFHIASLEGKSFCW